MDKALVLVRGGGDLASGVILRLHRSGVKVVVSELPRPLAVRRSVSFAEAVYEGAHTVEGLTARLVESRLPQPAFARAVTAVLETDEIPVVVDPDTSLLLACFDFLVVVDARLTKQPPHPLPRPATLHIGLGPGFQAGENCDAVIETRRSHTLGRVYWHGSAQADSGQPEGDPQRVLRAAQEGLFIGYKKIGEHCEPGELLGRIEAETGNHTSKVIASLRGVLRGLIRDGVHVTRGLKIGDVDPRDDPDACFLVSDKALAIGGGVLEAVLSRGEIREKLWAQGRPQLDTG